MPFALIIVSVAPLRKEPSHRAEQVTQVLFGEAATILETSADNQWLHVKMQYDQYQGWVAKGQVLESEWDVGPFAVDYIATSWVATIRLQGHYMQLPFGTQFSLSLFKKLEIDLQLISGVVPLGSTVGNLSDTAQLFLNTPYLWGGKSIFGIDCSGFTQTVYKCLGIALLRDAYQQYTQGRPVMSEEAWQTGDLAFFHNEKGLITHVGMMLDASRIIHASNMVRIDTLEPIGIRHADTKQITHLLSGVRRIEQFSSMLK
jgi:hypothetical protein